MTSSPVEIPASAAPATVRLVAFAAATFAAGSVGRATYDETLGMSLVWPLYGWSSRVSFTLPRR